MTTTDKTPKPKSPYAMTNTHRWTILGFMIAAVLSLLIGGIFSLPFFSLLFYAILVGEALYIITLTMIIADATNHHIVDFLDSIVSMTPSESPAEKTEEPQA